MKHQPKQASKKQRRKLRAQLELAATEPMLWPTTFPPSAQPDHS